MSDKTPMLDEIEHYYSNKILEHGAVAKGVDWNGEESQTLRFEQLSKLIGEDQQGGLVDWGCGYGAYSDYLEVHYPWVDYTGIDISPEMIASANDKYPKSDTRRFLASDRPEKPADWCVASGIFNVRLENSDDEWFDLICQTLDLMNEYSTRGFAFNALTRYSDAHKMRNYLYYASPENLFGICKSKYSRSVALLHDYDLYEFTLIVRKSF